MYPWMLPNQSRGTASSHKLSVFRAVQKETTLHAVTAMVRPWLGHEGSCHRQLTRLLLILSSSVMLSGHAVAGEERVWSPLFLDEDCEVA